MLYYNIVALIRKCVIREEKLLSPPIIPSPKITLTPPILEGFLVGATVAAL